MSATVTAPVGVTLSKIMLGESTITKTNNYTYNDSTGTLALKAALLSAQANGEQAFVLHMSNGDTATITVTVGA